MLARHDVSFGRVRTRLRHDIAKMPKCHYVLGVRHVLCTFAHSSSYILVHAEVFKTWRTNVCHRIRSLSSPQPDPIHCL